MFGHCKICNKECDCLDLDGVCSVECSKALYDSGYTPEEPATEPVFEEDL